MSAPGGVGGRGVCMCLVWVVVVVFGVVGAGSSTGVRPWGMTFPSAREYLMCLVRVCACVWEGSRKQLRPCLLYYMPAQ